MFWADKHNDTRVHKLGEFLAHGFHKPDPEDRRLFHDDRPKTLLYKLCELIESKKQRKIEIRIDRYDSWNAAHTLSMIALPLLKQLAEDKSGSPFIDDEDVPEGLGLRSTEAPPKENDWDTDENFHKRWAWIIKEIIWAHQQILDDSWEDQFRSGKIEFDSIPCEDGSGMNQLVKSPNDTSSADYEGMKKYQERINNGMRLFGKYYETLWS
jgi:hypothetical protein